MKSAASLAGLREDEEIREAARRAARRDGLSLGDWLDEVMTARAQVLGLDVADLPPDQRIQAVMKGLGWEGGTAPADPPAGPELSLVHPAPPVPGAAPEAAGAPASAAPATDGRDGGALAGATSRQAAQRAQIEGKLGALFQALSRPPRRHVAEAGSGERHADALMGETAISPSWRLERAVAEIAERQAFLDHQNAAGRPAAPRHARLGAPRAAAADLMRAFAAPDSEDAARAPDFSTAAVRTETALAAVPRAAAPVPSIFTALQGDIARLSKRLDTMHTDTVRRQPGPAPIDLLGRKVEELSAKLDQAEAARGAAAEAVERLSRRIEEVHAEVAARLAAPASPAAMPDLGAIETLVREVVVREGRPGLPALQGLEQAVQDLASKLSRAEGNPADTASLADLQAQIGDLAHRLDRTDAGLTAIVALERSMGEVEGRIVEMRDDAVATAGRVAEVAAADAVKAAFAEGERRQGALVERVALDLAELRASREDADQRLHAILSNLNTSLERVVDRLGALEEDVGGRGTGLSAAITPVLPLVPSAPASVTPRPPVAEAAAPPALDLRAAPPVALDPEAPIPQPVLMPSAPVEAPGVPVDLDTPIEPGSGQPRLRPDRAGAGPAVAPDPAGFIAAARRAAQAAAQEQAVSVDTARLLTAAPPRAGEGGTLARWRRPLLLALASLVLLVGAAQIVRLSLSAGDEMAPPPVAATMPRAEPAAPATPAEPAPAARTAPAQPVAAEPARPAEAGAAEQKSSAANLPTLAMGPAANLAAVRLAEASAGKAAVAKPEGLPDALRTAAEAGRADAQFEAGLRYADGRGVARDLKAAAGWLEKAAGQGLAPAAYRLGSLYERGLGVGRDPAKALAWYTKAADAGHVRAMHNLAVMLAEGATGKPDYAAAASWFRKAGEAGVKDSQFNLGILYARGLGVDADLGRSYTWFSVAAAQDGDAEAVKKRDEVAAKLDPKALAAAKAAAEAFKPVPVASSANEVSSPPGGWDAASAKGERTSQVTPGQTRPDAAKPTLRANPS